MSTSSVTSLFKNNKFNGKTIDHIEQVGESALLIVHTKSKIYFTDDKGIEISGSSNWSDYYIEPISGAFYRKDSRHHWFDIDGLRLASKVFILDDILISLSAKKSKQSVAYRDQPLYTSRFGRLFQVGKLVYDINLNLVNYFGDRVTAIGDQVVQFHNGQIAQQVWMGRDRSGFILEEDLTPIVFGDYDMSRHIYSTVVDNHHYEVFQSNGKAFVYDGGPDNLLEYEGRPANIDLQAGVRWHDRFLVIVQGDTAKTVVELSNMKPFILPCTGTTLFHIDYSYATKDHRFFNIVDGSGAKVYDGENQVILSLKNERLIPDSVHPIKGFEKYWIEIRAKGQSYIMRLDREEILCLEGINICKITGSISDKLINVETDSGESIVLDIRQGVDAISIAKINDRIIRSTINKKTALGGHIIQTAAISTSGGTEHRMIDINQSILEIFTLPKQLREYQEQDTLSAFAGSEIVSIDDEVISLGEHTFLSASIKTYIGDERKILLNKKSGNPIQIDGAGHRNELVVSIDNRSISNPLRIGKYVLYQVKTITEELKYESSLMEGEELLSWLPFYDTYLPLLRQSIIAESATDWPCRLYELREKSEDKEYIAIENQSPYRILVQNRKDIIRPKIIKSKEKVLKTPEQFSTLKRIFLSDPGYLIEVE